VGKIENALGFGHGHSAVGSGTGYGIGAGPNTATTAGGGYGARGAPRAGGYGAGGGTGAGGYGVGGGPGAGGYGTGTGGTIRTGIASKIFLVIKFLLLLQYCFAFSRQTFLGIQCFCFNNFLHLGIYG